MDQDRFAPYASPENIMRVLGKVHSNGLKGPIDGHFLLQLGIGEGMIARTQRALEFLGFDKKDGSATERLDRYIVSSQEEARAILAESVRDSYEMIFRAVSPGDERTKVFNAFKMMKPQGQWDRMVTLYLHLCREAGFEVKDPPPNRGAKGEPRPKAPKAARAAALVTKVGPLTPALPPAPPRPPMDAALVALADKLREIHSVDDFDEWVIAYRPLLSFVNRLKTA